jgi:ATP-dependent Clp protease ATP-binding subunit ClpA
MLSRDLQIAIELAQHEALARRHTICTLEHLLFALLHDPDTADILTRCDGDVAQIREELETYLQGLESIEDDQELELTLSIALQRAIRRSILHVQGSSLDEVHGFNVLVAIYAERDSFARYILEAHKVSRFDVVTIISHGLTDRSRKELAETTHGFELPAHDDDDVLYDLEGESGESVEADPLAGCCRHLNAAAEQGQIDPLVGRLAEVSRLVHILSRRRKNNPILVGDSGVGKTAIVEGLALKIHEGKVPEPLKNAQIYELSMGALLAGTRFRGDFEQRLKEVVDTLVGMPEAILFIDEIHTIVGAGATGEGSMDTSNLLKPALQSGALRCIGSTTYDEYRKFFGRDRALARRFQKVEVLEPSVTETIQILRGLQPRYEDFHGVRYSRPALVAAAELSAKHLRDHKLPDKAIDLVDEAGAAVKLKGRKSGRVGTKEIERVLSTMAKIPPKSVSRDDRSALKTMDADLKRMVFGQDEAVDQLVQAIKLVRAGIGDDERPVGAFMFTGPTGVGKTELARQLAFLMGVELIRFDMSEYMERHTVSRLIGAPPGYVGYDQGGQLTEAVSKSPHSVLLLDEIEKAHGDVFNILLQVMDHGTLTDNNGRTADFRNVILIMTSNVGARDIARGFVGFGDGQVTGNEDAAYKRLFSPEFRNRIDAKISFLPLDMTVMERIVDKFIMELEAQLEKRKVELTVTGKARLWLADKGYDPAFGARPLARVIKREIKEKLADEILFGALSKSGHVKVDVGDESLTFEFSASG